MSTGNDREPWDEYRLTIHGIPRTKKTHNEIHLTVAKGGVRTWLEGLLAWRKSEKELLRGILQRVKLQPSKKYRQWVRLAVVQWAGGRVPPLPIDEPVSICASIYRDRAVGDVQGFTQAIGDYLEQVKILKNDSLIEHWDGTRRFKDVDHPRIELIITSEVSRETPRTHHRRDGKDAESIPPGYEEQRGLPLSEA